MAYIASPLMFSHQPLVDRDGRDLGFLSTAAFTRSIESARSGRDHRCRWAGAERGNRTAGDLNNRQRMTTWISRHEGFTSRYRRKGRGRFGPVCNLAAGLDSPRRRGARAE
jgi:hypothetical protein